MPLWQWVADGVGFALLLLLLFGIALIVRRRLLARNGGTFEFSVRVRSGVPGRGWLLGVGRYSGGDLQWFRIFSLAPRPKRVFRRPDLAFVGSREPVGAESYSLYSGHVIVTCRTRGGNVEVAMSPASLTGFLAWLESAPPGERLHAR